jgi:hypothetical protein
MSDRCTVLESVGTLQDSWEDSSGDVAMLGLLTDPWVADLSEVMVLESQLAKAFVALVRCTVMNGQCAAVIAAGAEGKWLAEVVRELCSSRAIVR